MDATQLRIGNKLHEFIGIHEGKRLFAEIVVRKIDADSYAPHIVSTYGKYISFDENLTGIPLTAELLERCGFIQSENSSWMEIPGQIAVSENGSTALFLELEWRNTKRILNFLHELQNYYKENIGTELTIKP